jgi:hypothetical protein
MPEFWHSALMPQLESRRSCQEVACYRPHTHDRLSIGLIDSGTTTFTGAASGPVPLAAGDVILIPAGHVHACNPENGRWQYQMIQADQDWVTIEHARSSRRDRLSRPERPRWSCDHHDGRSGSGLGVRARPFSSSGWRPTVRAAQPVPRRRRPRGDEPRAPE